MNIITTAATRTGIPIVELIGKTRRRDIVMARHCVMWIMRKKQHMTLSMIGKVFDRDHTSVIHGITKVNDYLDTHDEVYLPIHNKIVDGTRSAGALSCFTCDGLAVVRWEG